VSSTTGSPPRAARSHPSADRLPVGFTVVDKSILIVEDEAQIAEALVRRLRARGYTLTHTLNVTQALEVFDLGRPDLVVLSLTLANDGGRQTCREIRGRPLGALVPILFVGTGREDVRSVGEAIAAGADHYFRKPEGLDELIGKVTAYIGPGGSAAEPAPAEDETALEAAACGDELFATINDVMSQQATPPPGHDAAPPTEVVRAAARALTAERVAADALTSPLPKIGRTPTVPGHEPVLKLKPDTRQVAREGPARPARHSPPPLPRPTEAVPVTPSATPAASDDADYGWQLDDGYAHPRAQSEPPPPQVEERPGRQWRPPSPPPPDLDADWQAVLHPGRAVPLAVRGVGEILIAAANARMTGRFEIASGGVLRRVFVEEGRPVYADSSSAAEDLASSLASEGMVTRSALERARQRAEQVGGTPEEVLIEAGFLQPDDVYRALRAHVIERILSLFALEAGEAIVVRGGPKPLDPVDLGLHPGRLVLDGVRRKYGRLRLYRVFGTASTVPRPRPGVDPPPGLPLRPDEESVWRCCDGHRNAIEVARAASTTEVDALAILYALGILDLVEGPRGRTAGILPPLEADAIARAGAPRTADQMPGFGDLVSAKFAEVVTADYFQVLGVPRTATGAEIEAAWTTLKRRFDPHRVRREGAVWHQVTEIAAVVDDAYALLADERLRERYERALS